MRSVVTFFLGAQGLPIVVGKHCGMSLLAVSHPDIKYVPYR